MERTKDEESKKFQSHNIEFDFYILVQIKELLVDVSSNCMESALKVDSLMDNQHLDAKPDSKFKQFDDRLRR